MARIEKITIKIDVKLSLWSAIKMRIAGIGNINKHKLVTMEEQLEPLGGLWERKVVK